MLIILFIVNYYLIFKNISIDLDFNCKKEEKFYLITKFFLNLFKTFN
jgi:hypothetical protein